MGKIELDHTGSGSGITLSSDGTDLLLDGTAVGGGGGGADLYAAETTGSTDPTATGTLSVAIGSNAQSDGNQSVAIGVNAVSGLRGVSIGQQAGNSTASGGDYNVSVGFNSAYYLTTGDNNVAVGRNALQSSNLDKLTGSSNVGVGYTAGSKVTSGSFNTFLGNNAGNSVTTGSNNVSIGYDSDCSASTSSQTAVGYNAQAAGSQATALTYSYASGADSFAAAITNNTSSYGATGANSIAMGQLAKSSSAQGVAIGDHATAGSGGQALALGQYATASGTSSIAIAGYLCSATGSSSIAIGSNYYFGTPTASGGGSIVIGDGSTASALYSMVWGHGGTATIIGKQTHATGRFSASGDSQEGRFIMRSDTTDATAEALTTNNSTASTTNQIILPNNSAYSFSGTIVARESAASGTDCAAWEIKGLIRREGSAGTTVLVNSATTVIDNTPSWGMALSADTTNGGLKIEVTGAAATNIRWVATIHTSEVIYA